MINYNFSHLTLNLKSISSKVWKIVLVLSVLFTIHTLVLAAETSEATKLAAQTNQKNSTKQTEQSTNKTQKGSARKSSGQSAKSVQQSSEKVRSGNNKNKKASQSTKSKKPPSHQANQGKSGKTVPAVAKDPNAPLEVKLVISEACGLVTFMDAISERHHTTTWLKDWYFKHRGGDLTKDKELIAAYQKVMVSNNGRESTEETGRRQDFNQQVISASAQCTSLTDFLPKLKSLAKADEYNQLKTVLEHFDPIYRALVWEPRLEELEQQLKAAQTMAEEGQISQRLDAVKRFMKAPWVPGLPFTVVYVPLPKPDVKHPNSHGESLGKVQIVELFPGKKSKQAQLDVVFHEACHALWHTRKDLDSTIKADFEKIGGAMSYAELDEGMATALGQGWFSKLAFGKTQRSWYMDEITNGYGHALYPILKEYLEENKSIDAEFAERATATFNKRFPKIKDDPKYLSVFEIYSDKVDDMPAFNDSIRKALPRLHSLSMSSPLNNAESRESFRNSKSKRMAILVSPARVDSLLDWGVSPEKLDTLKNSKEPVVLKLGEREVLFCIADSPIAQQSMMFSALARKSWPKPVN